MAIAVALMCGLGCDRPTQTTFRLDIVLAASVDASLVLRIDALEITRIASGATSTTRVALEPGALVDREYTVQLASDPRFGDGFDVRVEALEGSTRIASGETRASGDTRVELRAGGDLDAGTVDVTDAGPEDGGAGPNDASSLDAGSSAVGCAERVVVSRGDRGVFLFQGTEVRVIGRNQCGVLGTAGEEPIDTLTVLPGQWREIAAGALHSCGISDDDESLHCWGNQAVGELGSPDAMFARTNPPVRVGGDVSRWSTVAAGGFVTCAVAAPEDGGELYCWGLNDHYQLGNGLTENALLPIRTGPAMVTFEKVAIGFDHVCALQTHPEGSGGDVWCWGSNTCQRAGSIGSGPDVEAPTLILGASWTDLDASSLHTCGLTTAGALECFGHEAASGLTRNCVTTGSCRCTALSTPTVVDVGPFVDLALYDGGGCVIDREGALRCWGSNFYGELGTGPLTLIDGFTPFSRDAVVLSGVRFVSVDAGAQGVCAVTDAGRVYCWGRRHVGDAEPRCPTTDPDETESVPTPREVCR